MLASNFLQVILQIKVEQNRTEFSKLFPIKGQIIKIWGFGDHLVFAADIQVCPGKVAWKQPWSIRKWMSMLVSQKSFICANRWRAGSDPSIKVYDTEDQLKEWSDTVFSISQYHTHLKSCCTS